jgi:hypothetical protein
MQSNEKLWQCPECGDVITDFEKASFWCAMPCRGCNSTTDEYSPRVGLKECIDPPPQAGEAQP